MIALLGIFILATTVLMVEIIFCRKRHQQNNVLYQVRRHTEAIANNGGMRRHR